MENRMIPTHQVHVHGYEPLLVPADTDAHRLDGEACINEVCGSMYEYERAAVEPDVYSMLDIGHNIGIVCVWAFHWWPNLRVVYAYDPNPGCGEIARQNVQQVLRDFPERRVHIHTVAVTSDPNPMFQLDARWGCSFTSPDVVALGDRKPEGPAVPVKAIHPADLPPADVVKLDAEGVEGEVIDHYKYWDGVKVFLVEWHSNENREKIRALGARLGWRHVKNGGEDVKGSECWVKP
jgi:FkbM family methyltransferase